MAGKSRAKTPVEVFRRQLDGEVVLRPASAKSLARFERELGRSAPPELVEVWRVHDRSDVAFGERFEFLTIADSIAAAILGRAHRLAWRESFTPFAQDGMGGILVVDAAAGGAVVHLPSEDRAAETLAADLRSYFEEEGVFAIPIPPD